MSNKLFNKTTFLAMFLILVTNFSYGESGGSGTGGGNAIGLSASTWARYGIMRLDLNKVSQLAKKNVTYEDLLRKLESATILATKERLTVKVNGTEQECDAMNIPDKNMILVSESRFPQIKNPEVKGDTMAHEVLGLLGLESTGRYQASSLGGLNYVSVDHTATNLGFENIPQGTRIRFTKPITIPTGDVGTVFPELNTQGIVDQYRMVSTLYFRNKQSREEDVVFNPKICTFDKVNSREFVELSGEVMGAYIALAAFNKEDSQFCDKYYLRTYHQTNTRVLLREYMQYLESIGAYLEFPRPVQE